MRRPAEAFIGSTKLVVSGGHGAPFHTSIPIDIGDIRIVDDVDVTRMPGAATGGLTGLLIGFARCGWSGGTGGHVLE